MSSNDEETNVPMSIASEVQEFSHVSYNVIKVC